MRLTWEIEFEGSKAYMTKVETSSGSYTIYIDPPNEHHNEYFLSIYFATTEMNMRMESLFYFKTLKKAKEKALHSLQIAILKSL